MFRGKNYSECLRILLSRRSIRKFKDKDIPIDIILKALDIARYAPSASNSQPWRFIIVDNREILNELSRLHIGSELLQRSKIGIVILTNSRESPDSYIVDASLAGMYLWLALHCLGLGAVWIQTLRNINEIRKILDIPDEILPIGILAVGWPDENPIPRYRKSLNEIVYINRYAEKIS